MIPHPLAVHGSCTVNPCACFCLTSGPAGHESREHFADLYGERAHLIHWLRWFQGFFFPHSQSESLALQLELNDVALIHHSTVLTARVTSTEFRLRDQSVSFATYRMISVSSSGSSGLLPLLLALPCSVAAALLVQQ